MGSLRVRHDWVTSLSLSCIGEGNGNPRQCSCLENPRGGGAWWAAVYGVAQSRTRLKRLSSSSTTYMWYFINMCIRSVLKLDRGAWWATVHRVTKTQTRLSDKHFYLRVNINTLLFEGYSVLYADILHLPQFKSVMWIKYLFLNDGQKEKLRNKLLVPQSLLSICCK